jgi:hypothetical protein
VTNLPYFVAALTFYWANPLLKIYEIVVSKKERKRKTTKNKTK